MALHEITLRIRVEAEHTALVTDDLLAAVRSVLPDGAEVAVLRHKEALAIEELTEAEVESWFAEEVAYPPEDRYLDALLAEGPVVKVPLPSVTFDRLNIVAQAVGRTPETILRDAAAAALAFEAGLVLTGLPGLDHWTADEQRPDEPFGEHDVDHVLTVDLGDAYSAFLHRVAMATRMTPVQALARMVAMITDRFDDEYLRTMESMWRYKPDVGARVVVECAVDAMTGRIRDQGFKWPADKPLPWSEFDCAAAVRGYAVHWPGEFDDFVNCLRGQWEMSDRYGFLLQR